VLCLHTTDDPQATWQKPGMAMFSGWGRYLSYGVPAAVMICMEWWAYEVVIFMSGEQQMAAHLNRDALLWSTASRKTCMSACACLDMCLMLFMATFFCCQRAADPDGPNSPKLWDMRLYLDADSADRFHQHPHQDQPHASWQPGSSSCCK